MVFRMLSQPSGNEICYFARHFGRKLQEALQNPRSIKSAACHKKGCTKTKRAGCSIVHTIVRKATLHLPANRALAAVFSVGELKCHGCPVITEPHEEILFVRKPPPAPRLSGLLLDVTNLQEHFYDT